ncbi:MAG: LysM peptidoglycan-binding domain-containing protein, partial [Bacteroidota bacterium]
IIPGGQPAPTSPRPTNPPPVVIPAPDLPPPIVNPAPTNPPVANPAPTTPAPVVNPTPAPSATQTHTVQSGDTLFSLSRRYNTTVEAIKALNGLTSNNIFIGQELRIK